MVLFYFTRRKGRQWPVPQAPQRLVVAFQATQGFRAHIHTTKHAGKLETLNRCYGTVLESSHLQHHYHETVV